MGKRKYRYLFIGVLLLIVLCITLQKNYPYLEAFYYNKHIEVNGVKFLQTESEFSRALKEKGEFINGMGGNGWRFNDKQIFIMTSSIGIFKNKVSMIETENPSHRILGLSIGDPYNEALTNLKSKGFIELSEGIYAKGNVTVQLTGEGEISRMRIGIQDPAYKDVVF